MKSLNKLLVLTTLASSMLLTGCDVDSTPMLSNKQDNKNTPISDKSTSKALEQAIKLTDWKLKNAKDGSNNKISVFDSLNKKKTLLSFKNTDNKNLRFNLGCNTYIGDHALSANNELTINSTLSTKKYCAELDAAEKTMANLLNQKSQLSLTQNGTKTLTMTMANGTQLTWEPRAERAYAKSNEVIRSTLRQYNWMLRSGEQTPENPVLSSVEEITELNAIKDKVKLSVNGNRLGYTTGCNKTSSEFEITDESLLKLSNYATSIMDCQTNTQATQIINQVMQQDTKITMVTGEIPTFTIQTTNPNKRVKFLTWEAVDKSQVDLQTSIDQFDWKLTNALKQNSPADSYLSTIPELIAVKDNVKLNFNYVSADLSSKRDNISYGAGCNNHNVDFKIDQNDVLSLISDVTMTEIACTNAIRTAESTLNDIIKKGGKLVMTMDTNKPTLTYTTGNPSGSFEKLVWQGTVK